MATDVVLSIVSPARTLVFERQLNRQLRLGVMHRDILPHFSVRRTKKLIADEVSSAYNPRYFH